MCSFNFCSRTTSAGTQRRIHVQQQQHHTAGLLCSAAATDIGTAAAVSAVSAAATDIGTAAAVSAVSFCSSFCCQQKLLYSLLCLERSP